MWLAHPSGSVAAQTSHHLAEIANRSKGHHLQIGYSQTSLFRPVAVALQRPRPPAESIDQKVHPAAAAVGVAAAGAVAQRAHHLLYSAEHHQKDCRQGSVARSGRLQTYYLRVAMAGKASRAVFQRLGSAAAGPQKANRRSLAVGAAAQLIVQRCRLVVAGAAGQLSDQKCFLVAVAAERQKASRRRPVAGHCYQMESFAVGVVAQFAVQRCSLAAAAGAAGQLADRRCCFAAAVGAAVAAVQTSQKKT